MTEGRYYSLSWSDKVRPFTRKAGTRRWRVRECSVPLFTPGKGGSERPGSWQALSGVCCKYKRLEKRGREAAAVVVNARVARPWPLQHRRFVEGDEKAVCYHHLPLSLATVSNCDEVSESRPSSATLLLHDAVVYTHACMHGYSQLPAQLFVCSAWVVVVALSSRDGMGWS